MREFRRKNLLLFVLLCITSFFSCAATLRFNKIDVNDGLAYNSVRAIIQDSYGYMWIGTEQGLSRYDGYSLSNYFPNKSDPKSLPGSYIDDFEIDFEGNLWLSSDKGLVRYNRDKNDFSIFKHDKNNPNSISSDEVRVIQSDRNVLWVATINGLDRFELSTNKFSHFPPPFSLKENIKKNTIRELLVTTDNRLWVASNGGLAIFNQQTERYSRINLTTGQQPFILSLAEAKDGTVWVGSMDGLYSYNPKLGISKKFDFKKPINTVLSLLVDTDDNLWVGTGSFGLYYIDKSGSFLNLSSDKNDIFSLSDNAILSLYEDRSNMIWVGTYNQGLNIFSPEAINFGSYDNSVNSLNCLPSADVRSVFQLENLNILLGTTSGLVEVNIKEKKCLRIYQPLSASNNRTTSISHKEVLDIFSDSKNNIWVGTPNGIDKFNRNKKTFESFSEQIGHISVFGITELSDYLMLRTEKGLYKMELKTNKILPVELINSRINNSPIHAFDIDGKGNLWVASNFGIFGINIKKNKIISDNYRPYPEKIVRALAVDKEDKIWFSIENDGLFIFDLDLNKTVSAEETVGIEIKHGFAGLYLDSADNIWLATLSQGLFKIESNRKEFTQFETTDGLHDNAFNFDSFAELLNGQLLFGGKSGFNLFDQNEIRTNHASPLVSLVELQLFGEPVVPHQDYNGFKINNHISQLKELDLSYEQNVFGLSFIAAHYLSPSKTKYFYKLEGFDRDWISVDSQNRAVTYNNISPGAYVFRVKAQTAQRTWSKNDVALRIFISPAPWLTWWAYTIYAIVFFLAVVTFVKERTRLLEKRAVYLQEIINKKTNELIKEKNKVELLLSRKNEEFVNVSHEFKTPLSLILGPLKQILSSNKNEKDIEKLNIIQRNGYRLLRMVEQLLDLETFQIKSITQRSLQASGEIIKSLSGAFAQLAHEKNIELKCLKVEKINFDFTSDGLEKILANLLSNAIKYTKPGGKISVSSCRTKDNELKISVHDTGIGIPANKTRLIFERYHRVTDGHTVQTPGAGIGLALVKDLVENHNGRIHVDSKLTQGTNMTVYLPIINEADDVKKNSYNTDEIIAMEMMGVSTQNDGLKIPQLPYRNTGQPRILVIEDNLDMQNYMISILEKEYQVIAANDGEQGVKNAISEVPDLIVSDVMMPLKDGYQVTCEIRNNMITDHIPIILLSARRDKDSRLRGWYQKADEYLTKPFDPEELIIRINNLLSIRELLRQRFKSLVSKNEYRVKNLRDRSSIPKTEQKNWQFITKFEAIIDKNYKNTDFKISELAPQIGMSERQVSRKLLGILDITPTLYLREYRLIQAAEQLLEGEPVSSVAYDVGFASHTYFTKCFKAKYGMTPSEYTL